MAERNRKVLKAIFWALVSRVSKLGNCVGIVACSPVVAMPFSRSFWIPRFH